MNIQLIYMYIKNINRCLENQEFSFTNQFNIKYDKSSRNIYIEENQNSYEGFWGPNISNINLIVGKNGAGKSTLLDLLADTSFNRSNKFNIFSTDGMAQESDFCEWFAIYHLENGSFAIEGTNIKKLLNIENCSQMMSIGYDDSIIVEYSNNKLVYADEMKFSPTTKDKLMILYDRNSKKKEWNKDYTQLSEDTTTGFKRHYLTRISYSNIYNFISQEYQTIEKEFTANNVLCHIKRLSHLSDEWNTFSVELIKSVCDLKLYNDKQKPILDRVDFFINEDHNRHTTNKHDFLITYLEIYCFILWKNIKDSSVNKPTDIGYSEYIKNDVQSIRYEEGNEKQYLYKVIMKLSDYLKFESDDVIKFADALSEINDDYFISSSEIILNTKNDLDEKIKNLLYIYESFAYDGNYNINKYIHISFSNLSNGEIDFIQDFANLYSAIDIGLSNGQLQNLLLCIDEPDESFHPEWSRKYVYYLTTFLNKAKFRRFKLQLIITTHSPFIVSDIPKEFITCIDIVKENDKLVRKARKARFGFSSNFYDIIQSDFFVSSPIGEFATNKVNKIIEDIYHLDREHYDEREIRKLKNIIESVGDELIRKKLLTELSKKERTINPNYKKLRIEQLEQELKELKAGEFVD